MSAESESVIPKSWKIAAPKARVQTPSSPKAATCSSRLSPLAGAHQAGGSALDEKRLSENKHGIIVDWQGHVEKEKKVRKIGVARASSGSDI